ncbi:TetR/AcrR family transcriptional regulator [Streptomyces sp. NRRL F-5053]|uniref:TetR/AcrR family transcriptional regulator n=1 Tax=Streptomyces sp. NRRL F-5053 TaxID=1463854 RepID=UPI0004C690C7|nr:TetR/AcrR family transcriptional regulator [Streptomyces sp. NRRL F-5053]
MPAHDTPAGSAAGPPAGSRAALVADTAIALLAERGLRGLTHRAVDEAAGLPPGSTSNHARTRAALLEATVRRLAVREGRALLPGHHGAGPDGLPSPSGPEELAELLASALHRHLTGDRGLLVARYELALEATRRPELRAPYDRTGADSFAGPLAGMLRSAGSPDPARHALVLLSWCEGILFTCTAGLFHDTVPSEDELRTDLREMLHGMLRAPTAPGPRDDPA